MESCPPLSCPLQSVTLRWHYPVHRWVWLSGDTILLTAECDSTVTLSCSPLSVTLRWHYPAHHRVWLSGDTILLTAECDSTVTLSCSPLSVTLRWHYPAHHRVWLSGDTILLTAECDFTVTLSCLQRSVNRQYLTAVMCMALHIFVRKRMSCWNWNHICLLGQIMIEIPSLPCYTRTIPADSSLICSKIGET